MDFMKGLLRARPSRGTRKKPSAWARFRARAATALLLAAGSPACAAPPAAACLAPAAMIGAAAQNAFSLRALPFSPFGRPEIGWETYLPLVQKEADTACPAESPGFADALARWQARARLRPTGAMDGPTFQAIKTAIQIRRPYVLASHGQCLPPPPATMLQTGRPEEGYGGKPLILVPGALEAYRNLARAARAESPAIRADPRLLTVFSSYRSPEYDAARCARDGNCDGVRRSTCSPHRTGFAMDLYLGTAPGYDPASTESANRLYLSRTPAYRWLVANAGRFGFANYPFEPWHWEWTGPR